jgi:hypothetical protein
MPRGVAHCTCRKCGAKFDKDLYTTGKGASKALAEKIEWAESGGIDECTDCWKAAKREAEKSAGLTCKILMGSAMDEQPRVYAVFGGDTYPHKDALKALGARWTRDYPGNMGLLGVLGITGPETATWVIEGADLEALEHKLAELDAKIEWPSQEDMAIWAAMRQSAEAARQERREKEATAKAEREAAKQAALDELGPKPTYPERINALWPAGGRWNGNIYGKPGKHRVYLGGVEVFVSDDEASAMTATLAARQSWQTRKDDIDKKYK